MADYLYDSLEDECDDGDDGRGSSDSLDLLQTESVSVKRVSKVESIKRQSSLCSRKGVNKEERSFFLSTKPVPVNTSPENNFLPDIKNKNSIPGFQALFNHSSDYETLAKKGLLLNCDGSFTKSPRSDTEKLPFITREYKNLVFQKQRTYNYKKKTASDKTLKAKQFSNKETPNCDLSTRIRDKNHVAAVKMKSSFQENAKLVKGSMMDDNLTDSMKRIILQNQNQKNTQPSRGPSEARQNPKVCFSEPTTLKDKFLESYDVKTKEFKPLNKHLSQFAINSQKQNLTYSERHQLRNGYCPLFLRHGVKKITSETTRSSFGDSVTGKLSEVSSRVLSVEDFADSEDEEKFYEKIIENDKNRAIKEQRGTVTGRSFEGTKNGSVMGSISLKELEKLRGSGRSSYKKNSKLLFIDIKNNRECPTRSFKKFSHYCSAQPPPKMSKTELALRGKTYGYLANARNILKFQSRIVKKGTESENLSPKFNDISDGYLESSEYTLLRDEDLRESPPSLRKNELGGHCRNLPKEGGFEYTEGNPVEDEGKSFYLPRVTSSLYINGKMNLKNVMRASSCLYYPGNQIEDEFTVY